MTIQSYTPIDGTLKLGTGGTMNVSSQVRSAVVEPSESVKRSDPIPVLSGEELPAEESSDLSWTLKGSVLQALEENGVVDYTWTNAGVEVDFELIPKTSAGRKVTGVVRLVPLALGGDVSKTERATSDFSWSIIGTPVFGDVA